jgi:putative flippase GtrA
MIARVTKIGDLRLVRYALASVGALAIDLGSFLAFLSLEIPAAGASALGYGLGIVAHWLLSSRAVFADSVAMRGRERTKQKSLFVGSAMVGLALTTGIVGLADVAGVDPRLAKVAAIGVSFAVTWMLRNKVVFRSASAVG